MRIFVSLAGYRPVARLTHWGLDQLLRHPEHEFVESALRPIAGPDVFRSLAASNFLDLGLDAALFLDDDVVFDPRDVIKLVKHLELGVQVVGACYVTKSAKPQPTCCFFPGQSVTFKPDAVLVKVMRLAGGFFLVSRKVLQFLSQKLPRCNSKENMSFWPFFMPYVRTSGIWKKDYEYVTEDYAFFDRCRERGFDVYLDPSIRLGHLGEREYRLEDVFRNGDHPMEEVTLTKEEHF